MACSILALYAHEEEASYSADEVNLTLKLRKKQKKSPKLSDGAIRLYERIVFRSKLHGYCWELDSTFAKEFDVCKRTIKRRMAELRKFGKIRCENKVVNMKTHRKIYPISRNVYGGDKNDPSGRDKNDPHNEIPIKEERMNDSEALQSSSSFSKEVEQAKASPKQKDSLVDTKQSGRNAYYSKWGEMFGFHLGECVRRWDAQYSEEVIHLTLKELHIRYYINKGVRGKQLEALMEDALKLDYYGFRQKEKFNES